MGHFQRTSPKNSSFNCFLAFDQATTLKMHFGPHNFLHGWKAVFDEQILAPRFGGLEPVTKALDFFQHVG